MTPAREASLLLFTNTVILAFIPPESPTTGQLRGGGGGISQNHVWLRARHWHLHDKSMDVSNGGFIDNDAQIPLIRIQNGKPSEHILLGFRLDFASTRAK